MSEIEKVNAAGKNIRNEKPVEISANTKIQTPQNSDLRNWASKITGGNMSDEVYNLIVKSADKRGVDRKLALAVAATESKGVQGVTSGAGAVGVMQLMPETARYLGVDPNDTAQNIEGGVRLLKEQLEAFGGDIPKALAAYNAGPGAVQKYGGIPPYGETQNYVKIINGLINNAPRDEGVQLQPQQRQQPKSQREI